MGKGATTRDAVIREALTCASEVGLEGLSLGTLAANLKLSKSGLFAHFKSKEVLQLAVLEEAIDQFTGNVVVPALARPRGVPRLSALFTNYLDWMLHNKGGTGCLFTALSQEYDDRPGPLRERLVVALGEWRTVLARAAAQATQEKQLHASTDATQLAFEIVGIGMAFHQSFKLFRDPAAKEQALRAFERLIEHASRAARS